MLLLALEEGDTGGGGGMDAGGGPGGGPGTAVGGSAGMGGGGGTSAWTGAGGGAGAGAGRGWMGAGRGLWMSGGNEGTTGSRNTVCCLGGSRGGIVGGEAQVGGASGLKAIVVPGSKFAG